MPYKSVMVDDESDPRSLVYVVDENDATFTEQQLEFRMRLGSAVRDARKISDAVKRKRSLEQLAIIARSALTRAGGDIKAVEIEFGEVHQELSESLILDRNRLLYEVVTRSSPILFVGAVLLVLFGLLFFVWDSVVLAMPPPNETGIGIAELQGARSLLGAVGYGFVGLYIGLIVSSMIRARGENGAEALAALQFHGFGVRLYNLYISIVLVVFIILLGFDILQIGIAGRLLNEFLEIPMLGLLVGAVCAAGEVAVSQMIISTVEGPEHRRTS